MYKSVSDDIFCNDYIFFRQKLYFYHDNLIWLQLETAAQTNRILLERTPPVVSHRVKVKKKKKKVTSATNQSSRRGAGPRRFSDPSDHYRLNLAEIPFVVGKVCTSQMLLPTSKNVYFMKSKTTEEINLSALVRSTFFVQYMHHF